MSNRSLLIVLLSSHRQRTLLSWCPFYQRWTVLLAISPWFLLKFLPLFLLLGVTKRISLQLLLLVLLMNEFSRFCMSNQWLNWSIHDMIDCICLPWCTSIMATHSPCFCCSLLCFVNSSFNPGSMLSLLLIWVLLHNISLSFNLWILVCIEHINSFLVVEVVYFLENNLASGWGYLIIDSLWIQFALNLGLVVSLLLKDRLVDVVIIIHFVIGLVLALDWTGVCTSVQATTGLAVDCGGCKGSKLVIASSGFFACCSLVYLSVLRIKSWISGVVGLRECVVTFSLDFGGGELVANLTCSWRWHLVSSNIW